VGGLADVAAALPRALAERGHRVMSVAPRYASYADAHDTGVELPVAVPDEVVRDYESAVAEWSRGALERAAGVARARRAAEAAAMAALSSSSSNGSSSSKKKSGKRDRRRRQRSQRRSVDDDDNALAAAATTAATTPAPPPPPMPRDPRFARLYLARDARGGRVDRVFVDHPLYYAAQGDDRSPDRIYTYLEAGDGPFLQGPGGAGGGANGHRGQRADLAAAYSVLCQAALAAPLLLWPSSSLASAGGGNSPADGLPLTEEERATLRRLLGGRAPGAARRQAYAAPELPLRVVNGLVVQRPLPPRFSEDADEYGNEQQQQQQEGSSSEERRPASPATHARVLAALLDARAAARRRDAALRLADAAPVSSDSRAPSPVPSPAAPPEGDDGVGGGMSGSGVAASAYDPRIVFVGNDWPCGPLPHWLDAYRGEAEAAVAAGAADASAPVETPAAAAVTASSPPLSSSPPAPPADQRQQPRAPTPPAPQPDNTTTPASLPLTPDRPSDGRKADKTGTTEAPATGGPPLPATTTTPPPPNPPTPTTPTTAKAAEAAAATTTTAPPSAASPAPAGQKAAAAAAPTAAAAAAAAQAAAAAAASTPVGAAEPAIAAAAGAGAAAAAAPTTAAADALLATTSDYAVSVFDPRLASMVRATLEEGQLQAAAAADDATGEPEQEQEQEQQQQWQRLRQQLAADAAEATELAAAEAELGEAMARLRSLLRPERPERAAAAPPPPAAAADAAADAAPVSPSPPPPPPADSLPPLQAVQRLFGRLLSGARVVMTVHNGGYQGEFDPANPDADVRRLGLPDKAAPSFLEGGAAAEPSSPESPVASAQRALGRAMEKFRGAMRGLVAGGGGGGDAAAVDEAKEEEEEPKEQQPPAPSDADEAAAAEATSAPAPPPPPPRVNWLRGGLLAADAVVTVSPEYARELAGLGTAAAAAGSEAAAAAAAAAAASGGARIGPSGLPRDLAAALRARGVAGILNGLDADAWDPSTDPLLPAAARFDARTAAAGKAAAKARLRRRLGLLLPGDGGEDDASSSPDVPLVAYVGRFESQKGVDVLLAALPALLGEPAGAEGAMPAAATDATDAPAPPPATATATTTNMQLVVLGRGQPWMERVVASLDRRYPGRAAGVPEFSEPLAHLVMAAADFLVVPSRFEPCGLVALAALRYGAPPIAASTGGLVDIVTEDVGYTFEPPPPPPPRDSAASAAEAGAAPDFRRAVAALASGVERAVGEFGTDAYAAKRSVGMARAVSWEDGPARQWEALLRDVLLSSSSASRDEGDGEGQEADAGGAPE
jgi:glycogen synthase